MATSDLRPCDVRSRTARKKAPAWSMDLQAVGWEKKSHHTIMCELHWNAADLITKSSLRTVSCAQPDHKKHKSHGPGRTGQPGSLWAHSLLAPASCQKPDARCVMTEMAMRPQSRPLLAMFLAVAYRTASCSSPSAPSETRSKTRLHPLKVWHYVWV